MPIPQFYQKKSSFLDDNLGNDDEVSQEMSPETTELNYEDQIQKDLF